MPLVKSVETRLLEALDVMSDDVAIHLERVGQSYDYELTVQGFDKRFRSVDEAVRHLVTQLRKFCNIAEGEINK